MTPLTKTLILLSALFFTACSATRFQAYWKIDQPLFDAIEELNKNPGNVSAQNALPVLYQQSVRRHEIDILKERFADHPTRYDKILAKLEALQHIYLTLRSVPVAFAIVKPKNYELDASRTEAELWAYLDQVLETDSEQKRLAQIEHENQQ
jgi:hypothetical protein